MAVEEAIRETIEYRVVLVEPDSRMALAVDGIDGYRLLRVRIPVGTRPAEQLRKAIKAAFGLHVLVLEFLAAEDGPPFCAVAELLLPDNSSGLTAVTLETVLSSEFSERQHAQLLSLLVDDTQSPFAQVGWINEAIAWLESATQRKLSSKSDINQYNAGGPFSLVRFHTEDDCDYWLKATGEPNAHELPVTRLLSKLGTAYLPEMISHKPAWNAWLMSGEATPIKELPVETSRLFRLLEDAVSCMAKLQMKTAGRGLDLLDAGAFDQGMEVFQKHSEALFDYLQRAMSLQTSTKVPRLDKPRLQEIHTIFKDACRRMEDLDLPQTIVHGDMNCGNVLTGCGYCQFIDWSEAYVGNPLITLQHLLLFNRVENPEVRAFISCVLKNRYRDAWLAMCDPTTIDEGFVYMPLLAVASSLYGRCDWLTATQPDDPRSHAYARNLARHMDQAARDPQLLEALRS
jgi:hypothetical protein